MASPASRQSSCFTSSTTPTTVNHCGVSPVRRIRCPSGSPIGPELLGRRLADDDAAVRRHGFVVRERAAPQQIDPHHAEVVAAGEVLIEQRPAAFRRPSTSVRKRPVAGAFVERDVVDDARRRSRREARAGGP